MRKGLLKRLVIACFLGASVLGHPALAPGQEVGRAASLSPPVSVSTGTETDDLRVRIERLEKQNSELIRVLQERQRQLQPVSAPENAGAGRDQVQQLVNEYLQEKEKKADGGKAPEAPKAVEVGSDLSMKASWKNGLQLETPNKDFKVHIGGRGQFDMGWFDEAPALPVYKDAADFRRARLRVDGTCWEVVNWVTEFDFANPNNGNATALLTDLYAEITQLPVIGTGRAGRFKVPFSLEELISDSFINHMERSLINQAFSPSRRLGFAMYQTMAEERMTFVAGFFRNGLGQETIAVGNENNQGFDNGDGEYLYATRVTWLPIWEEDGRCLLHLGAAYNWQSFNNTDNPDPTFASRTSFRIGTPVLLNTGSGGALATSDHVQLLGTEVSANYGVFNFMSETMIAQCHNDNSGVGPNPFYWGTYAQVSCFLTGEHRVYNRKAGAYDRQPVNEPFFAVRSAEDGPIIFGLGAWEVIARYSYLDLHSDGLVVAPAADRSGGTGVLQDITLGVNWYWNPNFKWMFNYVRAWRDSDTGKGSGIVDGFGMRVNFDF